MDSLAWTHLLISATSTGGGDPLTNLVGYGVAAPFIAFLLWHIKNLSVEQKEREKDWKEERHAFQEELRETREDVQTLNDKLLEQQERLLPLMAQSAKALESVAGMFDQDERDYRRRQGR